MDFIALDFETANEKRDSACAIGIAFVRGGAVSGTYFSLVRPKELRFAPLNVRIHGISETDVKSAPTLAELWPDIESRISGQLVIAHNASFDMSVLRHSLYSWGLQLRSVDYLCSCQLSKQAWPGLPSFSLGFLAPFHGIHLDHHDARSDANASAELILLAGRQHSAASPLSLAEKLGVNPGHIFCDGTWCPSCASRSARRISDIAIEFPDDFDPAQHQFYRQQVVFTGTLMAFRRDVAKTIISSLGGIPKDTVSRKTNFLVAGEQDLRKLAGATESSKLRTAKELRDQGYNIQIITESDFLKLVLDCLAGESSCQPTSQENDH